MRNVQWLFCQMLVELGMFYLRLLDAHFFTVLALMLVPEMRGKDWEEIDAFYLEGFYAQMPWIMAFATKIITDNIKEKGLSIVEDTKPE